MEEGLFNAIQRQAGAGAGVPLSPASPQFSNISFAPRAEAATGEKISPRMRDIFATAGLILGGIAVVSWFVIVIGVLASVTGGVLSFLGSTSAYTRRAKIGLILSAIGGSIALLYMIAIYAGLINYNYFTNELWGIPAGGVQVLE